MQVGTYQIKTFEKKDIQLFVGKGYLNENCNKFSD